MKRLLLSTALLAAFAPAAFAAPQLSGTSTLNIFGNATYDTAAITFQSPASLGTVTGDFTALASCFSCVTVTTPLTYAPFTAGQLATVTEGTLTGSVDLVSNVSTNYTPNLLTITDKVMLHLTGFQDTPGVGFFSVNQATGVTSGSVSITNQAQPAPEPSSLLLLLGSTALGLGVVGLRRRR